MLPQRRAALIDSDRFFEFHVAAFEPRHYLDRAYASATLRQAPREAYETDLSAAEVQTLLGNNAAASAAHAQALAGFAALGMTSRIAAISPPVAAAP